MDQGERDGMDGGVRGGDTRVVGAAGAVGARQPRLVGSVPEADWLPPGSTAEMWAGPACEVPEPCIIVRLLLTRPTGSGTQFFTVPTDRGLDLPTLRGIGREHPSVGAALDVLSADILGANPLGTSGVPMECIGYVRNVVPAPDADYPHPTPEAFVPVFTPREPARPIVTGTWLGRHEAAPTLAVRHWWPIVAHHLRAG